MMERLIDQNAITIKKILPGPQFILSHYSPTQEFNCSYNSDLFLYGDFPFFRALLLLIDDRSVDKNKSQIVVKFPVPSVPPGNL